MSTAEYAAHRGVSDSYIRRMGRVGHLVKTADGLIDPVLSDRVLDAVTNPVRGGKRGMDDESTLAEPVLTDKVDVHEAVRRERLARARLAEIELGEKSGKLTRVDHVNRAVFTLVRQALNQMQGMGARLSKPLAAESDPFRVAMLIDADVMNICQEMRAAADKLLDATGAEASMVELDMGDDEPDDLDQEEAAQ